MLELEEVHKNCAYKTLEAFFPRCFFWNLGVPGSNHKISLPFQQTSGNQSEPPDHLSTHRKTDLSTYVHSTSTIKSVTSSFGENGRFGSHWPLFRYHENGSDHLVRVGISRNESRSTQWTREWGGSGCSKASAAKRWSFSRARVPGTIPSCAH
jgi:hypothetical protein